MVLYRIVDPKSMPIPIISSMIVGVKLPAVGTGELVEGIVVLGVGPTSLSASVGTGVAVAVGVGVFVGFVVGPD